MVADVRFRAALLSALLATVLTVVPSLEARASPGTLDHSFGGDGKITTNGSFGLASGLAIQQDGKIVAVGSAGRDTRFGLTRYNPDGTLDPSFGGDGKVSTDFTPGDADEAKDVAVQADGSLVVFGQSGFIGGSNAVLTLARYLPDGGLDPSFGDGGVVMIDFDPDPNATEFAAGVAIDAQGKIVAGGSINSARFGVVRYDADGNPDGTFDGDGMVTTKIAPGREGASDVAIQADGRIVVVGDIRLNRFALVRYTDEGALDSSFGGDGTITTNFGRGGAAGLSLAIQANGKIVAAGYARGRFALARYDEDGTLDPSFGGDGKSGPTSPPGETWPPMSRSIPRASWSRQVGASSGRGSPSRGIDATGVWTRRSGITGR